MTVGTKSVLFGVHAFWIHPFVVAMAWTKLYGFPLDPRIWCAFFLHDIGYISCTDMDGDSGRRHPYLGARIMYFLFGSYWGRFTLFHSRAIARSHNSLPSRLCIADKLSWTIEPWYVFLPRAYLSGEIYEYMYAARGQSWKFSTGREFYICLQAHGREIVADIQAGGIGKWCSGERADTQAQNAPPQMHSRVLTGPKPEE